MVPERNTKPNRRDKSFYGITRMTGRLQNQFRRSNTRTYFKEILGFVLFVLVFKWVAIKMQRFAQSINCIVTKCVQSILWSIVDIVNM